MSVPSTAAAQAPPGGAPATAATPATGATQGTAATPATAAPTTPTSSTPLSSAQLVARANALCASANQQVLLLPANDTDTQNLSDMASFAESVEQIGTVMYDGFRRLTPPSVIASLWKQFVTGTQAELMATRQLLQAAGAANRGEVKVALQAISAHSTDHLANELGLSQCARDVEPSG